MQALADIGRVQIGNDTGANGRPFISVRFLDLQREAVFNWFYLEFDGVVIFDHSYSQNTGKAQRGIRRRLIVEEMIEHAYARWCVEPKFSER